MAKNFQVEKDGKTYVYNSTSVYDASTKKKKTVSVYIGRLDPETGKMISKKERSSGKDIIDQEKMRALRFGGSYALLGLSENIGLRDDLFCSFGIDGEKVLACAVAQALAGADKAAHAALLIQAHHAVCRPLQRQARAHPHAVAALVADRDFIAAPAVRADSNSAFFPVLCFKPGLGAYYLAKPAPRAFEGFNRQLFQSNCPLFP